MRKEYEKPKITNELSLERELVYADPQDETIPGCTTMAKNIEIKDNEAKLT